ncbi:hypothetical protein LZ30DRAFT_736965 [Colletotrichum cereale]|nr:hypothetical protein LZ30DRAFT_736965 [Colletotrichum cereale]
MVGHPASAHHMLSTRPPLTELLTVPYATAMNRNMVFILSSLRGPDRRTFPSEIRTYMVHLFSLTLSQHASPPFHILSSATMSWELAMERAAVAICCILFGFVVSTFLTLNQNQISPSTGRVLGTYTRTFQSLYLVQNILPLLPVLALFCIEKGPWAVALATYMNLGEYLHMAVFWHQPYLRMKVAAAVAGTGAMLACILAGVELGLNGEAVLGSLLLGTPGIVLAGFFCCWCAIIWRNKLMDQEEVLYWFRRMSFIYGTQAVLLAVSTLVCIFVADVWQIFFFVTLPAKLAWTYRGLRSMLRARKAGRGMQAKTKQPSQENLCNAGSRIGQSESFPSEHFVGGSLRATLPIDRQPC